jgi:hypothetical protein
VVTTTILFFRDPSGRIPALDWLEEQSDVAQEKLVARLRLLQEAGYRLQRPAAAPLGDGIHELRARVGTVQYRLLYFFWGGSAVIIACGLTKEAEVARAEIERALTARTLFDQDPARHSVEVEV